MKPQCAALAFICLTLPVLAEPVAQPKKKTEVAAVRINNAEPTKAAKSAELNTAGRSIMRLDEDVDVQGRPCKRGWLKLHSNGTPLSFTAAREMQFGKLQIPAETWVMQDQKGVVQICALPRNLEIQGVPCRGTGGAKGVQLEVYPCGSLKKAFLSRDAVIQGVPCAEGLVSGMVEFYPDGKLKSCRLSDAYTIGSVTYKKGARLELPANVQGEKIAAK